MRHSLSRLCRVAVILLAAVPLFASSQSDEEKARNSLRELQRDIQKIQRDISSATSRKGKIRIEMEAAYRASGVQTIILRAGNFIDPDRNKDVFSLMTLTDPAKPKITSLGDPGAQQSWVWMPDWAKAAADLAEKRAELA